MATQDKTDQFSALQTQLQDFIATRQKLQAQQSENESVQKEFANLDDDAGIYKLTGPVLLKQEKAEAKMAVQGRLDFIAGEIKRVEGSIKELQDKSEVLRNEIYEAQVQQQQQQEQSQGSTQTAVA